MKAIYLPLTTNVYLFQDLLKIGESHTDLKFTLVDRLTHKAVDLVFSTQGKEFRHEGVDVTTIKLSRDDSTVTGYLTDWWNGTELYEINLEWYHIDTAVVSVNVKGNPKHIQNFALMVERV